MTAFLTYGNGEVGRIVHLEDVCPTCYGKVVEAVEKVVAEMVNIL